MTRVEVEKKRAYWRERKKVQRQKMAEVKNKLQERSKEEKSQEEVDLICEKLRMILGQVTPKKKALLRQRGVLSPKAAKNLQDDGKVVEAVVAKREELKYRRDRDSLLRRKTLSDVLVMPFYNQSTNSLDSDHSDHFDAETSSLDSDHSDAETSSLDSDQLSSLNQGKDNKTISSVQCDPSSSLKQGKNIKASSNVQCDPSSSLKQGKNNETSINVQCDSSSTLNQGKDVKTNSKVQCDPSSSLNQGEDIETSINVQCDPSSSLNQEMEVIHTETNVMSDLVPILYENGLHIANHIYKQMHPCLRRHYVPVSTLGDGNCLWNMLSQSLIGDDSLMGELRVLSTKAIHQNMNHFQSLLTTFCADLITLEDILDASCTEGVWGGEYHLYALSIALRRPIYIYCSQTSSQWSFL